MVSEDMHEPQQAQETVTKHYKEYAFCKVPFTWTAWTAAIQQIPFQPMAEVSFPPAQRIPEKRGLR